MTIYNENGVPVLYRGPDQRIGLSTEANESLGKAVSTARRALESDADGARDKHQLMGHSVVIHNKAPLGANEDGQTLQTVGASTLDEALTEVIGGFDMNHVGEPGQSSDHIHTPDWVASTHKELGEKLADYYSCELRDIAEVI